MCAKYSKAIGRYRVTNRIAANTTMAEQRATNKAIGAFIFASSLLEELRAGLTTFRDR
jgi:hypothetical protein